MNGCFGRWPGRRRSGRCEEGRIKPTLGLYALRNNFFESPEAAGGTAGAPVVPCLCVAERPPLTGSGWPRRLARGRSDRRRGTGSGSTSGNRPPWHQPSRPPFHPPSRNSKSGTLPVQDSPVRSLTAKEVEKGAKSEAVARWVPAPSARSLGAGSVLSEERDTGRKDVRR